MTGSDLTGADQWDAYDLFFKYADRAGKTWLCRADRSLFMAGRDHSQYADPVGTGNGQDNLFERLHPDLIGWGKWSDRTESRDRG